MPSKDRRISPDHSECGGGLKTGHWQDRETLSTFAQPSAASALRGPQAGEFLSGQSSVRLLQDTDLETVSHSLSLTALKTNLLAVTSIFLKLIYAPLGVSLFPVSQLFYTISK